MGLVSHMCGEVCINYLVIYSLDHNITGDVSIRLISFPL